MFDAPLSTLTPDAPDPPLATTRDARGRFVPGQSGNPAGKRPGTRHIKTLLKEAMTDDEGHRAARVVIEAAVEGDKVTARWLVGRIDGAPKGRFIEFAVEDNGDMTAGLDAAFRGVMDGTVTLAEAWDLMRWIQAYRNTVPPRRWMDSPLREDAPAAETQDWPEAADAPVAPAPGATPAPAPARAASVDSPAKHLHFAGEAPSGDSAPAGGSAGSAPTSPPLNRAMRRRAAALARAA